MAETSSLNLELGDLYSEINLQVLLNKIVERICSMLDCEESSIFLYDSLKERLYFEIATGDKQNELKEITLKMGEGIAGWIAQNREPVIINDCAKDPRFTKKTDDKTKFRTRSIAGIPVIVEERLLGVIEAINKNRGGFTRTDIERLQQIAHFITIPLENAMLFKKVMQETKEKDRLIELGKIISSSFSLDEVFATLKDIITEMISLREIQVWVQSQQVLYKLIGNEKVSHSEKGRKNTSILDSQAIFPLRTTNKSLGILELQLDEKLPKEMIDLVRGLAVFAAISIEKFELVSEMIKKERMDKELQIAKEIQQSFLLNEKIDLQGLDVAYVNIPSSEVGGDYYDIIPLGENRTIVAINDISGHGVPASLLMSIFRANFVYRVKRDQDIEVTIGHLNNLIAETTETNLYVTSFTCLIDRTANSLTYVNAGHISPFIVRGKQIVELKEASLVVGMFPDMAYNKTEVEIKPGDLMVLCTDGVIEAENPQGEQFSYDRLKKLVAAHGNAPAEQIKEILMDQLKEFVGQERFEDDITFMIVKII